MNGTPLFMGKNEEDQLRKIFKVMGSPNLDEWPDAADYPDFSKFKYSISDPTDMQEHCPRLDDAGLDLLNVSKNFKKLKFPIFSHFLMNFYRTVW